MTAAGSPNGTKTARATSDNGDVGYWHDSCFSVLPKRAHQALLNICGYACGMTVTPFRVPSRALERSLLTLGVALMAVSFGILAYIGIELTRGGGRIAALWLPNAVLVGVLLRTRTNSCPYFVAACFGTNVAVNIMSGDTAGIAVILAAANAFEVIIAVAVMRYLFGRNPVIEDLRTLAGLFATCLIAPGISGLVAGVALAAKGSFDTSAYTAWVIADGLSLMIVTPLIMVAVDTWRTRRTITRRTATVWMTMAATAAGGAALIFAQQRFPFLFLACPLVVFAAFRGGVAGTAIATAIVAIVACAATLHGSGPIMLVHGDVETKIVVLQAFLAAAFAMGLPVAAVLAGKAALQEELQEAKRFTGMMLDNVMEIIFRTDAHGRWIYLNPAWTGLTGYDIDESIGWPTTRLLHPDDKSAALDTYPKIASGALDQAVLRQRFIHKTGECRHIEVVVRRLSDADGNFVGTTGNIRDVSDAVRRERDLAESEARFRCMAEAAPVGIFRADAAGQVTYVNGAWCKKVGLTVDESLGTGWIRAVTDPGVMAADPPFQGLISPGEVRRRLVRFHGAHGGVLWMEAVHAAEFDEAGVLTGYVGVMVDVTEQRAATQALVESERKFQTLADLAPAGIFRTDGEGNCNYVNNTWLCLTGFSDESWMNDGWASALHPDDRDRVYAAWAAAVAERRDFRQEWRWVRKDGSISWVDGIGRPEVNDSGSVTSFVGVNIDITERREAEAKLAERDAQLDLLATNATDGVFRIGLDGRCIYASPSVERLTGITPSQIVGRQMLARLHPEDCATVTDAFLALASGAASQKIITYRSEKTNGGNAYQWLEANCAVVRDAAGKPAEVIASIRDVTQNKLLEEDLRQARERAENAVAAKAAFLANMSHEIRTPMNGVLGFTELLAAGPLNEEQQRQIRLIGDSGRAMMRLLNDILDISKIESGQMQVSAEPVDIRHKLKTCVRLMEPVAVSKGLNLSLDVDPSIPQYVLSDPLRIRQIVLNLIGNALKFTERGSVSVRVRPQRENDADQLRVEVVDTGVGIPEDRLTTIFQQFAQADTSIARRFGGTGLGLSISSELAELMGGSIGVSSLPGRGSTFTLRLPMVGTKAVPEDQPDHLATLTDSPRGMRRVRVLIAEDHDINQMLMLSLATVANFDATIANDGEEAVTMVEQAERDGTPYCPSSEHSAQLAA